MKEKRILCIEVSGECRHFADANTPLLADAFECQQGLYCTKNTAWKLITKGSCKNCKEAKYQGLTREQAIEKIAKAICLTYYDDCSRKCERCFNWKYNVQKAEAALNALLEDKNVSKN